MGKIKSAILIDGNDIDNFVNRKILEKNRITEIITFKNPNHALAYLTETKVSYHLILIDIYTPILNGFEFIDKFHHFNLQKKHGKIYILSASINPIDIENCHKRNITFIEKPLNIEKTAIFTED